MKRCITLPKQLGERSSSLSEWRKEVAQVINLNLSQVRSITHLVHQSGNVEAEGFEDVFSWIVENHDLYRPVTPIEPVTEVNPYESIGQQILSLQLLKSVAGTRLYFHSPCSAS